MARIIILGLIYAVTNVHDIKQWDHCCEIFFGVELIRRERRYVHVRAREKDDNREDFGHADLLSLDSFLVDIDIVHGIGFFVTAILIF